MKKKLINNEMQGCRCVPAGANPVIFPAPETRIECLENDLILHWNFQYQPWLG